MEIEKNALIKILRYSIPTMIRSSLLVSLLHAVARCSRLENVAASLQEEIESVTDN